MKLYFIQNKKNSSPPQINSQKDNSLCIKHIRVLGWQVGLIRYSVNFKIKIRVFDMKIMKKSINFVNSLF